MPRDNAAIVATSRANTDPLVAEKILGRIHSYIQSGRYDRVMLPPQVYDRLDYAHWCRGDARGARENFRKALELQPGFSSDYSAENYSVAGP